MAPYSHGMIEEGTMPMPNKRTWKVRAMTAKSRVQSKSMLPKTAINFYNMKKGLYLKNSSKLRNFGIQSEHFKGNMVQEKKASKSVNLLNAYGELAAGA